MKKVAFYTLGCKLNFSETSTITRMFENSGFEKVNFEEGADIYVINTCSVTENADKKCRKVVKEAQRFGNNPYILVMGCYAQLKPHEISGIPGVDAVLGAAEKFRLFEYLQDFEKSEQVQVHASEVEYARNFHHAFSLHDRTRTFLKVQDGCDYACTFCTIPKARGKSRSDTIENIYRNAIEIANHGVKEIVLTGVNTGDFGIRNGQRIDKFIDLLRKLDRVEGIDRFRISSIEPNLLTDEIIEFVSQSGRFVPHFHMPLQSGSDTLLKKMRRRYLSAHYRDRVASIKSRMPDACIGADIIVGFPGETDKDFLMTYEFLRDLEVSYLHVFPYSERANTPATEMDQPVPMKVRQERARMLRNLSTRKRKHFYSQNLGSLEYVLFENDIENGMMHGFTRNYIRVAARYDPIRINEIVPVYLQELNADGYVEVREPARDEAFQPIS